MWETIGKIFIDYGPFPAGIIVGMWLTKWSISQQLKYSEKEKDAIREEKKQALKLIESQQKRIDRLHEKIAPIEKGEES